MYIYDSRDVFKTMEESRKGIEAQKRSREETSNLNTFPGGTTGNDLSPLLTFFCASIPLRDSSIVLNTSLESYIIRGITVSPNKTITANKLLNVTCCAVAISMDSKLYSRSGNFRVLFFRVINFRMFNFRH